MTTRDDSAEMASEIGRGIEQFTEMEKNRVSWILFQVILDREDGFLKNLVGDFECEEDKHGILDTKYRTGNRWKKKCMSIWSIAGQLIS